MGVAMAQFLRISLVAGVLLIVTVVWGQPTTRPAQSSAGAAAGEMTKREFKEQKWKRKMEDGKRREQKLEQHIAELQQKGQVLPTTRPMVANARQVVEDFDWSVYWEQKSNRGVYPQVDYGYSTAN